MAAMLLVSETEAMDWGFYLSHAALRAASARIRGYLGQQITSGTSTTVARGPAFRLPQRPVVAVASVLDEDGDVVAHTLNGSLLETRYLGLLTVTYSHGYAELPEELVELVCRVAQRIGSTPDTALAAGVQTQSAGAFSVGYGWDAWKAQSGLTQGEKDTLNRYWPRLPQIITAGPAA